MVQEKFGRKLNKSYPRIVINNRIQDYGAYLPDENLIEINIKLHKNRLLSLINTLLHEYKHYLQKVKWKIYFSTEYKNNVYEKQAIKFAKKNQFKCYKDIIKLI